jgi:probable phosphoglycerate mutase
VTTLALLRHGPTDWTAEGRIQGRTDVPLSAAGRAAVAGWRLPDGWAAWRWLSSPLARTRETAAILGVGAGIDDRLVEMDWGEWEGRRLADLRASLGPAMAAMEARGLDLRPPGGESPRDVAARLAPLLAAIAADGRDTVAVCHKGVIRAVVALATGWDMAGRAPVKVRDGAAVVVEVTADGPRLTVDVVDLR